MIELTATCKHCGRAITWGRGVVVPGYIPRDGWTDGHPRHPFLCGSAADLTHSPRTPQ